MDPLGRTAKGIKKGVIKKELTNEGYKNILFGEKQSKNFHIINFRVSVKSFLGATLADMKDYVRTSLQKNPDHIIVHAGTNDLPTKKPKEIVKATKKLCKIIEEDSPSTKITISSLVVRSDNFADKVCKVNSLLERFCCNNDYVFLKHDNIDTRGLNRSGLHLNKTGNTILAKDFISQIRRF